MINLTYCLIGAAMSGVKKKPYQVMQELGIKYERWEAWPICDQIRIYECSNVPEVLPDFISINES